MLYTEGAKHFLSYRHSHMQKCDARIALLLPLASYVCYGVCRGACPQEILKITCSEIDFGGILCKK